MEQYDDPDRIYNYEYNCENHSILDKFYKYWWRIAIKAVPARMSANLLSIIGNSGSWLALIIGIIFGAALGPKQPWIFAICGLAVFFYHTVDCLDGIQARRIGASGPLGEFVDHWFDAMNVFFFPLTIIVAFPVIPIGMAILLIFASSITDWIVFNQVLKTKTLYISPLSSGEGITLHILFLFSIPILGYGFWATPSSFFGIVPLISMLTFVLLMEFITIITTLISLRFAGWKNICIQLASTLPLVPWILLGQSYGTPRWTLILGLLTIGFVGTRHVGDLLRVRLLGLKYPAYYLDLIIGSCAALVIAILFAWIPGFPLWAYVLPIAWIFATNTYALVLQFSRTIRRVKEYLDIGLFDVPAAPESVKMEVCGEYLNSSF